MAQHLSCQLALNCLVLLALLAAALLPPRSSLVTASQTPPACTANTPSALLACFSPLDPSSEPASFHETIVLQEGSFPAAVSQQMRARILDALRLLVATVGTQTTAIRLEAVELHDLGHWGPLFQEFSAMALDSFTLFKPGSMSSDLFTLLFLSHPNNGAEEEGSSVANENHRPTVLSQHLRHLVLSDLDMQPLLRPFLALLGSHAQTSLPTAPSLEDLVLRDISLSDDGLAAVFAALPASLHTLEISSHDKVSHGSVMGSHAAEAFGKQRTLTHLRKLVLGGLDIHDDVCRVIMSGVSYSPALSVVSLRHNNIGDECAESIVDLCQNGAIDHVKFIILTLNHISASPRESLATHCGSRGVVVDTNNNHPRKGLSDL